MEFTYSQTVRVTAYLLLALAITQAIYTALYLSELTPPRQLLWGLESLLFTILAAFAGAAMVQTTSLQVGWSAIAVSAVFNLVQVSIGVTMFVPFREAASQLDTLAGAAGGVYALSFMIYYAAKMLLGLAAIIFGMQQTAAGSKVLGRLTLSIGAIAMLSNAVLMSFGRDAFLPSPVAGGSGVIATLLLALCLMSVAGEEAES